MIKFVFRARPNPPLAFPFVRLPSPRVLCPPKSRIRAEVRVKARIRERLRLRIGLLLRLRHCVGIIERFQLQMFRFGALDRVAGDQNQ